MKEGHNSIINSKSKTFLAFCFCFILGIGIFSGFGWQSYWLYRLYLLFFVICFFLIIFLTDKKRRFAVLCFLFFVLGGLRFFIAAPADRPGNINYFNGAKAEVTGIVAEEPTIKANDVSYVLEAITVNSNKVSGKILFKGQLYPRYEYGDELKIICSLAKPMESLDGSFNYRQYLARQGIWSVCNGPKIIKLSAGGGQRIIKNLLWLKGRVADKAAELWSEPESSFMAGLLYGERSGLPQELTNNFSRTGISHIIAISGYNISVVAVALLGFFITVGLSRPRAFYLVVAGIIIFVIFTGAGASVVRAGIMGIIVMLAGQLGRVSRIGNVLIFTAALMLLVNPYILIWDAGFQLSFLATLGLVYLAPVLAKVYYGQDKPSENFFSQTLISTLSAVIITFPLILFQFGRFSVVAPVVNLLVLWLIPYLMLLGFLAIMTGFIFYPLGQTLAYLAWVGLKYVIIIVNWFGSKNWAAVEVSVPWWAVALMYAIIIYYVQKSKNTAV